MTNQKGQLIIVVPLVIFMAAMGLYLYKLQSQQNFMLSFTKQTTEDNLVIEAVTERAKTILTKMDNSCIAESNNLSALFNLPPATSSVSLDSAGVLSTCYLSAQNSSHFDKLSLMFSKPADVNEVNFESFAVEYQLTTQYKKTEHSHMSDKVMSKTFSVSPVRLNYFGLILHGGSAQLTSTGSTQIHFWSPTFFTGAAVQELADNISNLSSIVTFENPVYTDSTLFNFNKAPSPSQQYATFQQTVSYGLRTFGDFAAEGYKWPFEDPSVSALYKQPLDFEYVYQPPYASALPCPSSAYSAIYVDGAGHAVDPCDNTKVVNSVPNSTIKLSDLSKTCAIPGAITGDVKPFVFMQIDKDFSIQYNFNSASGVDMFCGLIAAKNVTITTKTNKDVYFIGTIIAETITVSGGGTLHIIAPSSYSNKMTNYPLPNPTGPSMPFSMYGIQQQFEILRVTLGRNFFTPISNAGYVNSASGVPLHSSAPLSFASTFLTDPSCKAHGVYCFPSPTAPPIKVPSWSDLFSTPDWYKKLALRISAE